MSPATTHRELVIETRDLDTDERDRRTLCVVRPSQQASRREQLAVEVERLHPGARIRSFGGDAATFLTAEHLIVAHYGAPVAGAAPANDAVEQQAALFSTER